MFGWSSFFFNVLHTELKHFVFAVAQFERDRVVLNSIWKRKKSVVILLVVLLFRFFVTEVCMEKHTLTESLVFYKQNICYKQIHGGPPWFVLSYSHLALTLVVTFQGQIILDNWMITVISSCKIWHNYLLKSCLFFLCVDLCMYYILCIFTK